MSKNNAAKKYFKEVSSILKKIEKTQADAISKAAEFIADSLVKGGILHLFGTGHSHMLAEEPFYRAGGLVPVNFIAVEDLMLHKSPTGSTELERKEGYAKSVLDKCDISEKDTIIVISNSGVNSVPVEMAMEAKKKGLKVIALTSLSHSKKIPPRHSSGKKLYEVADIVLDNCGIPGDAVVKLPELKEKVGPTSTIAGAYIINAVILEAIQDMIERGFQPPIFLSANIPGGMKHNKKLIAKYKDKIKLF